MARGIVHQAVRRTGPLLDVVSIEMPSSKLRN